MGNDFLNKVDRSKACLKVSNTGDDNIVKASGPELLDLVWQLSAELYSIRGVDVESRLQRDVAKLTRQ